MNTWTEYGVLLADRRTVAAASSVFAAATYDGQNRRVVSRDIACTPGARTGDAAVVFGPWQLVPRQELADTLAHRAVDGACGQNSEGD